MALRLAQRFQAVHQLVHLKQQNFAMAIRTVTSEKAFFRQLNM
jgi:hypothetical protein